MGIEVDLAYLEDRLVALCEVLDSERAYNVYYKALAGFFFDRVRIGIGIR